MLRCLLSMHGMNRYGGWGSIEEVTAYQAVKHPRSFFCFTTVCCGGPCWYCICERNQSATLLFYSILYCSLISHDDVDGDDDDVDGDDDDDGDDEFLHPLSLTSWPKPQSASARLVRATLR